MTDSPSAAALDIPLRLLKPVKLNETSGLSGFLWPIRKNLPPGLVVDWDGKPYAIYLEGQAPLRFFPIKLDVSLRGLLIEKVEFIVDVTSRYDAVQISDPMGALVVKGGRAYLMAVPFNNGFADPGYVPLWGEYEAGTEEEAVGFYRWKLIARDEDRIIELWSQASEPIE